MKLSKRLLREPLLHFAVIVRLKFMIRSGDQFAVRTKVFTKIRELFEQEGIKFAHREVTTASDISSGVHRIN